MEIRNNEIGCEIPYDFCAVQDKNLIEDSLWASAQKMNDYDSKLELVYMAQLMTPQGITGDQSFEYKLVKNAFDALLDNFEIIYKKRQRQFEQFNDELVKSGAVRVARQVKLAIEAYREEEILKETHFQNLASELFVMENNQPYRPDNDNCPF